MLAGDAQLDRRPAGRTSRAAFPIMMGSVGVHVAGTWDSIRQGGGSIVVLLYASVSMPAA
jgi:hypothetical protein